MSGDKILLHCSPTLAGLKTGNLVVISFKDLESIKKDIRVLNRRLSPKGVVAIPLRFTERKVWLYIFRPNFLKRDLGDERAIKILKESGYTGKNCYECVCELKNRLIETSDFPHEIGLFLGYPPEDVDSFIKNNASGYKLSGTWKVYHNVDNAVKTFKKFEKCTASYLNQWQKGKSVERLTVVV